MRVIINNEFYKNMELFREEEVFAFMKITKIVAEKNSLLIESNKNTFIKIYNISEQTIEKFELMNILNFANNTVSISENYIKLFNKHAEYQKQYRERLKNQEEMIKKIEIESHPILPQVTKETKEKEKIDYDNFKTMWNEMTDGTKIPKIDILNDKRKKIIKTLFSNMIKNKDFKERYDINNYVDFYDGYFKIIKDDQNILNGWMNTKSNTWFQPGFDYLMKETTAVKLIEEYERKNA